MGADFVGTKPVPVHTGDQEAAQKENQFFFFLLTQGLQEDLLQGKRWVSRGPRTPSSSRKALLPRSIARRPGVAPGVLLHGDQLASALTLDEFSSSSSSLKELVLRPLLSLSAQHSIRPPEER